MNTCPYCHRNSAFYENYAAEKKTFKLWNCIYCGFKRKDKKLGVPKKKSKDINVATLFVNY